MSFAQKVEQEALVQKEFKTKNQPIPKKYKVYARKSGLGLLALGLVGLLVTLVIFFYFESLSIFLILFTLVIVAAGLIQIISGRHLITKR